MEADGFVRRTKDLLFASFHSDDAYLIGIFEHGNWTRMELATITVRNWPHAGIFRESRSALRLAQPTGEADRPLIRNAGVTLPLEIDGEVYIPYSPTLPHIAATASPASMSVVSAPKPLGAKGVPSCVFMALSRGVAIATWGLKREAVPIDLSISVHARGCRLPSKNAFTGSGAKPFSAPSSESLGCNPSRAMREEEAVKLFKPVRYSP